MNRTRSRGRAQSVGSRRATSLVALSTASMLMLMTGCGSDDDDSSAAETTASAAEPDATDPGSAETDVDMTAACDTWIEADSTIVGFMFGGQSDADAVNAALDAAIAAADPAVEQTLVDLKASAQSQLEDPESEEGGDETFSLYGDVITWAGDSCDVETLDVAAVDYGFEGLPAALATGYHIVNFSNTGNENHEMFAFRFNDDTTESVDELFALPEEEAFSKIAPVNAAFAPAGASETVSWNLVEPGRYAIFCAIPVGSVGEAEGQGPPHFAEGMIEEFTVE